MFIEVQGLSVRYGDAVALSSTDLRIKKGEVVAITGPSGSGKSTLLGCIAGVVAFGSGSIVAAGVDYATTSVRKLSELRRQKMGMIFQDADLLPELSVAENVAITLLFDGEKRTRALQAARDALEQVGMGSFHDKRVTTLSGGEAQRVSVARALVRQQVELVIADEPTASLDIENSAQVVKLITDIARKRGVAALIATHDREVALACDRVVSLRTGFLQDADRK